MNGRMSGTTEAFSRVKIDALLKDSGWNVAARTNYDYRQNIFIYNATQATYNTDCCGFSFEWRRFAIGQTRNENQFRVALSIANVGSFGTLSPRERMF